VSAAAFRPFPSFPRSAVCRTVLVFLFAALSAFGQVHQGRQLVEASLLADTTAIVPGEPFQAGLLLKMAPGWHTYWEYSGDAGLPTTIDWKLPPGFVAGPIQWPAPEAKLEPGNIQTYAYSGRVLLITTITPPTDISGNVTLSARADWLVCEDICIPGGAEVSLALPVEKSAVPAHAALFEEFRSRLPSEQPPPYPLEWSRNGDTLRLEVRNLPVETPFALFPLPSENQTVGHPAIVFPSILEISAQGPFRGVLAVGDGPARRAWYVSEPSS